MSGAAFLLFATPIGTAALAWRGERLIGSWLPESDEGGLRRAVRRRLPEAIETPAPLWVERVAAAIVRLLSGECEDLRFAELDLDGAGAFDRAVWTAARAIEPGTTLTYRDLAARLGEPGAARAVGAALGRNPFPIVVPCHRILAATGTGGFSAPGGRAAKMKLLEIERARLPGEAPGLFATLPLRIAPQASD